MASAWGNSFGSAFNNSWGAIASTPPVYPEFVPPNEVGNASIPRRRYIIELTDGVEIEVSSLEEAVQIMKDAESHRQQVAPEVIGSPAPPVVRINIPTQKARPQLHLIPPLGGIRRMF